MLRRIFVKGDGQDLSKPSRAKSMTMHRDPWPSLHCNLHGSSTDVDLVAGFHGVLIFGTNAIDDGESSTPTVMLC